MLLNNLSLCGILKLSYLKSCLFFCSLVPLTETEPPATREENTLEKQKGYSFFSFLIDICNISCGSRITSGLSSNACKRNHRKTEYFRINFCYMLICVFSVPLLFFLNSPHKRNSFPLAQKGCTLALNAI